MKRVRIRWAALAVVAWMAACGVEGGRTFLSLGTGGTGGIYYPLGGALASRLSIADESRQYTAEVSGGSVEHVNRLAAGQIDLAFVLGVPAFHAQAGRGGGGGPVVQVQAGVGDWEEPVSGLRVLAPLYPNLTHVLVPAGSDAAGISDLAGQRVSVGSAGSGTEQVARHLLQAYGLSYDDIDVRYLSFTESSSALRDGAIDAAVMSVGYPAAAVLEATTTAGVRLLPVDPDFVAARPAQHPHYTTPRLPSVAYPGATSAPPPITSCLPGHPTSAAGSRRSCSRAKPTV